MKPPVNVRYTIEPVFSLEPEMELTGYTPHVTVDVGGWGPRLIKVDRTPLSRAEARRRSQAIAEHAMNEWNPAHYDRSMMETHQFGPAFPSALDPQPNLL